MKSETTKVAGKASLDPIVVRGFRVSDWDRAMLQAEDDRVRSLCSAVRLPPILAYHRNAKRITFRMISTARDAKSFWERMTHNAHADGSAASADTVRRDVGEHP